MPRAWRQAPDTGFFSIHPVAAEHYAGFVRKIFMTALDLLPISFIA
jgi:hypothetical protein